MLTLYELKPRFQKLLRPMVTWLHGNGVTANQVTLAALGGSLLIAVLISSFANHSPLFALMPVWLLVRMALNAMDGMLAREFGQQSRLGAYLNELSDVIADTALFCVLFQVEGVQSGLLALVILLALLSEYAGVMGPLVGATRRYDGPLGKSDRAACLSILALGIALGWLAPTWLNVILALMALLLVITLANRIRSALNEAGRP